LVNGDYRTYLAEFRKSVELSHDAQGMEIVKAVEKGYATGGGKGLLDALLRAQTEAYDRGTFSGLSIAQTCALLGKRQEAMQYLQEDFKKHDPEIISIRNDIALQSLHDDPAFRALLSGIGLPPL
jgi:hypothetical protein